MPAIYQTDVPVSMAKMIMSRHVSKDSAFNVPNVLMICRPSDISETIVTAATGTQRQRSTIFQKTTVNGVMLS